MSSIEVRHADDHYLYLLKDGIEEKMKKFDVHVIAAGLRPKNDLMEQLSNFTGELYVIGDAKTPRRGADAVLEGARVGHSV